MSERLPWERPRLRAWAHLLERMILHEAAGYDKLVFAAVRAGKHVSTEWLAWVMRNCDTLPRDFCEHIAGRLDKTIKFRGTPHTLFETPGDLDHLTEAQVSGPFFAAMVRIRRDSYVRRGMGRTRAEHEALRHVSDEWGIPEGTLQKLFFRHSFIGGA